MEKELSIIIPAYNEEKLLPQCLSCVKDAAAAFRKYCINYEVIVCDNNSTDKTSEIASSFGAHVVFEPHRQIAKARNKGASMATGKWLLFLDADSFPHYTLFELLCLAIKDPKVLGGGACLTLKDAKPWANVVTWVWNCISKFTRWAPGAFLFCRTFAFRELGGFNENLYVSEEIELSQRLKQLSKKLSMRMIILAKEKLLVSGRKSHLYSFQEHLHFILACILNPRRAKSDPSICFTWYDGRR